MPPSSPFTDKLTVACLERLVRDISLRKPQQISFILTFKGKRQAARYFRKLKREIRQRNAVLLATS